MGLGASAVQPAARATERAFWLAWLANFAFFGGFYAVLVPLPRRLAAIGLDDWQIGLILGTLGVAALVGRPASGVACERFGARRVMLLAAGCFIAGSVGLAAARAVPVLFGLRVLQAVGYVGFTTAATALVVAVVAPEERGRQVALFGAGANLAISLSPAAIGALLVVAPVEAGLLAAAALAVLAAALALRLPAVSLVGAAGRAWGAWVIPRRLWLPMLAAGLLGAGFAAFFQFAPILADRRAVASGLLYSVYGASVILTRLLGGRLLDRLPVSRVVLVAALLMGLGHALIAASDGLVGSLAGTHALLGQQVGTLAPLLLAAALVAASGGLFHPGLIAHHAALLPSAPGRASAAFYVAFDLGIGAGSWLFGAVLQLAGLPALYWTAAALALLVLPLAPRLADSSCSSPAGVAASPAALR